MSESPYGEHGWRVCWWWVRYPIHNAVRVWKNKTGWWEK